MGPDNPSVARLLQQANKAAHTTTAEQERNQRMQDTLAATQKELGEANLNRANADVKIRELSARLEMQDAEMSAMRSRNSDLTERLTAATDAVSPQNLLRNGLVVSIVAERTYHLLCEIERLKELLGAMANPPEMDQKQIRYVWNQLHSISRKLAPLQNHPARVIGIALPQVGYENRTISEGLLTEVINASINAATIITLFNALYERSIRDGRGKTGTTDKPAGDTKTAGHDPNDHGSASHP